MTLVSLDTNILIYALDPSTGPRHAVARDVVSRAGSGSGVLTQQVIGEFLNVSRRLKGLDHDRARRIAQQFCTIFPVLPTSRELLFDAFDLAQRATLQFWDSLIVTVCQAHDVGILLSADMQDGQKIGTVTILDPFAPSNRDRLEALLTA